MSLLDDISEFRVMWGKVGLPSRFLLVLTTSTSVVSAIAMVEDVAFQFTGALLRLVQTWHAITAPVRNLFEVVYPPRSISSGEADFIFLFTFLVVSIIRTAAVFQNDGSLYRYLVPFMIPFLLLLTIYVWHDAAMSNYTFFPLVALAVFLTVSAGLFLSALFLCLLDNHIFKAVSLNIFVVFGSALVVSGVFEGVSRALGG